MNAEHWNRLKEIVAAARELPEGERAAYVEAATAGDAALRAEALGLLGTASGTDQFLESPLADAAPAALLLELASGQRVGEFELVRELGRGGMGIVFLARQLRLEREVALKILTASGTATPAEIERFHREAQAMGRLSHPGIVKVLTDGEHAGIHYFAMEFVPGTDLQSVLQALRSPGRGHAGVPAFAAPGFIECAVRIVAEAAEALEYAHAAGVVHRDVKPQNLLLAENGAVRVLDFGIARDARFGALTRGDQRVGTPHYMSPEQALASRAGVDHRTDVYSLGVVLFELLTLQRPFEGSTSDEVLHHIVTREAPAIGRLNGKLPRDLAVVCEKAIEKDPADRFQSAGALAADLRRFLAREAIQTAPPSAWRKLARFARKQRVAVCAAALVAGATALGAIGAGHLGRTAVERAVKAELATAEAAFDDLAPGRARDVASRCRHALESAGVASAELERRLRDLESRSSRRAESRADVAEQRLRRAARARRVSDLQAYDPGPRSDEAATVRLLVESALDTGALSERLARALAEATTASLAVRLHGFEAEHAAARIHLYELDSVSEKLGPPAPLDPASLGDVRIAPGRYRLVAILDETRYAETTVWLARPTETHAADVWLRELGPTTAAMVAIPAGAIALGHPLNPPGVPAREELVEYAVAPYFIDRSPVTHGEYARYLAATGRAPPAGWIEDPSPELAARPVVNVTVDEARGYAEWAGKRLPTRAEWEFAARGPERWKYPWGNDPADPRLAEFNLGRPSILGDERYRKEGGSLAWYLEQVRPSRPAPAGAGGPYGLDELLGNVQEWSDSTRFDWIDGEITAFPEQRFRLGLSCVHPVQYARERGFDGPVFANAYYPAYDTGFRCAKSAFAALPPPPPTDRR